MPLSDEAHASVVPTELGPSDAELVTSAQLGDAASLGVLLERHRSGMHAVALSLLGWGPETEDVVQDAILVALRRLGDLREPAAAGPWLRSITRNAARMRLRSARHESTLDLSVEAIPSLEAGPEQLLDDHALRDWVWAAIDRLTEPLQTVVLLRHFSQAGSYEQIAAACDIPVGTVRSRLSMARRKLVDALHDAAVASHPDAGKLTARRRRDAEHLLSSAVRGQFETALADAALSDFRLIGPNGERAQGQDTLVRMMNSDLEAGVKQRLIQVTASRSITLLECELVNPARDPNHCPPGVLWLMALDDGRIGRIRLFHPSTASLAARS